MLQFRLFGAGAVGRGGDGVDARQRLTDAGQSAQIFSAPVHRDKGLAHADLGRCLQRHDDGAAPGCDVHQVSFIEQPARHVLRVHLYRRLGDVAEQAAERAGATHAVPLVAQPAGCQRERVARLAWFSDRRVDGVDKARAAVFGGEDSVFIKPYFSRRFAFPQWPLLRRGVEHRVAHAGDVEVAATGRFAVFVPDGFGGSG